MTVRVSKLQYDLWSAQSPAGKLLEADQASGPISQDMWDHTEDWRDPKHDWELFATNESNGYFKFAKCKNTGVVRSITIGEYYEKTPLRPRKEKTDSAR